MIAARTDATHRACVAAIRSTGLHVRDLSRAGQGCADLLVTDKYGRALEVEVKDGKKPPSARRLTDAQVARLGVGFVVVGCVQCAVYVYPGVDLNNIATHRNRECCGVRGPVDGATYWRETK